MFTVLLHVTVVSFSIVVARNVVPLGCWDDSRSDRAMPIYVRNMRNDIDWRNIHLIVEQCMAEAVAKGT